MSLLLESKISSFYPASVTVQSGLGQTWSETSIIVFLTKSEADSKAQVSSSTRLESSIG